MSDLVHDVLNQHSLGSQVEQMVVAEIRTALPFHDAKVEKHARASLTTEELREALLALQDAEFETLSEQVATERRRRLYAGLEARFRPADEAQHNRLVATYGERDFCRTFDDALDGFVVHTQQCPNWPKSWLSGSNCVGLRRGN